ncbi:MAG: MlaD family protein [Candidatus Omnitrophica bacterium]|jgi:phospholipid/cholesterol/gamma-HCH transport system substrate-binding protein|nr:MlaD family protein [Candidatus Omnitrophota bacterium]
MPKIFTNEVKTGFVVLVCIGILTGLTIMAGNFKPFQQLYCINVVFSNVSGIEKDAAVRLAGVEVGKVESVRIAYGKEGDTSVLVKLELFQDARIREGARAAVTTLGLMGEKYIELTPGDTGAGFLKAGATIRGKDPIDIEAVIDEARSVMEVAKVTMTNISDLAKNLNGAVSDNRGNIDEIMDNLKRTTENLEEFTDDIKRNPWKLLVKGREK